MPRVVTDQCTNCQDCLFVCPTDAVANNGTRSFINPDECTDSGGCEAACPVGAIVSDDELPDGQEHILQENFEYFKDVNYNGTHNDEH